MELILSEQPKKQQFWQLPDLEPLATKNIEGLPPIPLKNSLWNEWKEEVKAHRDQVTAETQTKWRGQQAAIEREVQRIKLDGRYLQSVYGAIYHGKEVVQFQEEDDWVTAEEDEGWVLPFIPYPFQLYYWDLQIKAFKTRGAKGDVAVVKSRQMGMSNMVIALYTWAWLVRKPFQARLLSRKEDLVDETNNPDSLFWKARLNLSAYPKFILDAFAPGFDWAKHSMQASLTNPYNMNHLAGESTNATAGRGADVTSVALDEFAFMQGGHGIWTATRAASYHRIAISSVQVKHGLHFYNIVNEKDESKKPVIFTVPWWLHPEHDDAWLAQERERDTDAGFNTEVLMNWFGDESSFVYPSLTGKQVGDFPYEPFAGPTFIAFDDGYRNNWAFWVIQYIQRTGRTRILDYYENKQLPVDFYGSLWRGVMLDGFQYGEDEREIMNLMRYIQTPVFEGDAHGMNVEQVSGMSVIERLSTRWGIFVNVDFEKRAYATRQEITARHLPFTDWNDNDRVRLGLTRVQTFSWKQPEEGTVATNWIKEPIKNESADAATALEYHFVNFENFLPVYTAGSINYE